MNDQDADVRVLEALREVREEIAMRADWVYEALLIIDKRIKALSVPR